MTQETNDSKERLATLDIIRKYIRKTLGLEAEDSFRKITWILPDGAKKFKKFSPRDGMEVLWEEIFATNRCPPYFIVKHMGVQIFIEPEWYRDHVAAELAARRLPLNKAWNWPPRFDEFMGDQLEMEVVVESIFPPSA